MQFSIGNGVTTVPLVDGQASYTTPASLDVSDYTVTATYTGDSGDAPSTTSEGLQRRPGPHGAVRHGDALRGERMPPRQ